MEAAAPRTTLAVAAPRLRVPSGPRMAAWTLGFAPALYLALEGGGYDLVIRSQVAVAIWWVVLVGAIAGALPRARLTRGAWAGLAILAGLCAWTALSTGWSSSVERSLTSTGLVSGYLGVLALGVCVLARRDALLPLLNGLATAFSLVAALAVLSRLHPAWFPHDDIQTFFPGATERLAYPLNYADGLGSFLALGLPILLSRTSGARSLWGRAAAAGALPVLALAIVMTVSRGGVLTAVVAVVAYFALAPRRLVHLLTAVVVWAGSALLIGGLLQRHDLRAGHATAIEVSQRHELLILCLVTVAGVVLLQAALSLHLARRPWHHLGVSRGRARLISGVALVTAVVVAIAAGVPSELQNQWDQFKQPGGPSAPGVSRLLTVTGSRRYQYWQSAAQAYHTHPVRGIGAGTYELWWASHSSSYEFVRNAHSLYMETLAELGLVGLALVGGLLACMLGLGVVRCLRAPPSQRTALAGAAAALAAFCAAAAYDWVWQIAVVPTVTLLCGAAVLAWRRPAEAETLAEVEAPRRLPFVALALAAMVALIVPLGSTAAVRASEADVRAGRLSQALTDARQAQALDPAAESPRLQRALILEQAGQESAAAQAIAEATARSPRDWRLWLVRSRIAVEDGQPAQALAYYRRARSLNPLSSVFAR